MVLMVKCRTKGHWSDAFWQLIKEQEGHIITLDW
jgi:hypothetical protein